MRRQAGAAKMHLPNSGALYDASAAQLGLILDCQAKSAIDTLVLATRRQIEVEKRADVGPHHEIMEEELEFQCNEHPSCPICWQLLTASDIGFFPSAL